MANIMTLKTSMFIILLGVLIVIIPSLNMVINKASGGLNNAVILSLICYCMGGYGIFKHIKNKK